MGYTQLLVQSYEVARTAHILGKQLCDISVDKGNVYVGKDFTNAVVEFTEAISRYKTMKENTESGESND